MIKNKKQFKEQLDTESLFALYEGYSFFSIFEGETKLYQQAILPCLQAKTLDDQSDGERDMIEHANSRRLKHILLQRHLVS